MNKNHIALLTEEGLQEIKKEHKELIETKRPELVIRIAEAREAGDLAENSEYAAAREDLAFVDGRIAEIENIINAAQTVKHTKSAKNGVVDIGCKVHLALDGKQVSFTIVGEWEANPAEQKISHESPLGRAIMGKKVGEKVQVSAPAGTMVYTIHKIE